MKTMIILINVICLSIIPIFIFWKSEYEKNVREVILTKDDTLFMRGIAAILIVLAHFLNLVKKKYENIGPVSLVEGCGGLGVCIFFFVSGYGLWSTYHDKVIDRNYIKKRFYGIVPDFFVLRFLSFFIFRIWEKGAIYSALYLINFEQPMWFITEIVLVYILYYIGSYVSKNNIIILMFIFLTIMSLCFLCLKFDERWYNANLVFVSGMIIARYKKEIIAFFEKRYIYKLCVCILLFMGFAMAFSVFKGNVLTNILKLIAGSMCCLIAFGILMKFTFHSKILFLIGKNSLAIYIIHLVVRDFFVIYCNDWNVLLIFLLGIILSVSITLSYSWIKSVVVSFGRKNEHLFIFK